MDFQSTEEMSGFISAQLTYGIYKVSQKLDNRFHFCDNFSKCTEILTVFTVTTRNLSNINIASHLLPHLYYVTNYPT